MPETNENLTTATPGATFQVQVNLRDEPQGDRPHNCHSIEIRFQLEHCQDQWAGRLRLLATELEPPHWPGFPAPLAVEDFRRLLVVTPLKLHAYLPLAEVTGRLGNASTLACRGLHFCVYLNSAKWIAELRRVMKVGGTHHWKWSSFQRYPSPALHPNLLDLARHHCQHSGATVAEFSRRLLALRQNITAAEASHPPKPKSPRLRGWDEHCKLPTPPAMEPVPLPSPGWNRVSEFLERYGARAKLYPDHAGREIYFDGRGNHLPHGCGFNGALILHSDSEVSVHT